MEIIKKNKTVIAIITIIVGALGFNLVPKGDNVGQVGGDYQKTVETKIDSKVNVGDTVEQASDQNQNLNIDIK